MKYCFKFKVAITLLLTMLCIGSTMFFDMKAFAVDDKYLDPTQFDDSSYNTITSKTIGNSTKTIGGAITGALKVILSIVRYIALGWAIIMAITIAIKYMSGNTQIKAQLKVDMPTYCIGAAILFGAAGILRLIEYFVLENF